MGPSITAPRDGFALRLRGCRSTRTADLTLSHRGQMLDVWTRGRVEAVTWEGGCLLLSGIAPGWDRRQLAESVAYSYRAGGVEAITAVDGAFAAVVVDHHRILAVTDRINSRKLYTAQIEGERWLSSSIALLPTGDLTPDLGGVASFLACDGTHLGFTPFREVEMLQPASVTEIEPHRVSSRRYWRFELDPDERPSDPERLASDYVDLVQQVLSDQLQATGADRIHLSLSGGYDSKGLLGMLERLDRLPDVDAFTYLHGEQVGDADSTFAVDAAAEVGIPVRTVPGYRGSLLDLIDLNASWGHGVAHFCDDGDVWPGFAQMAAAEASPVLLTGDRYARVFTVDGRPPTPEEMLSPAAVNPPTAAGWFFDRLEAGSEMAQSWGDRYASVLDDLGRALWRDGVIRAYLEHRVANTLMLWREHFGGQAAGYLVPYLDGRVLDFVAHLPSELVDGGVGFHQRALATAFPHLFRSGVAGGGWKPPNWRLEMIRAQGQLRERITSTQSRLDQLIPPSEVLRLLDEVVSAPGSLTESESAAVRTLRRAVQRSARLRSLARRRRFRRKVAGLETMSATRVLRGVLTLRELFTLPTGAEPAGARNDIREGRV